MNERTQKQMYCLYDSEMGVIQQIFFSINDISCQRALSDFVNSNSCPFNHILDKIEVYRLASYCEQTGEFNFVSDKIADNQCLYTLKDFVIEK